MKAIKIGLGLFVLVAITGCGGSTGATGAAGANGTSDNIAHGVDCSNSTVDSGTGTTLDYIYSSRTTASGDLWVSCTIANGSTQASDSAFYKSGVPGATNGNCFVKFDLNNSNFGYWQFTSVSGTTKTVYSDSGDANDGYTYTFSAGDCTSF